MRFMAIVIPKDYGMAKPGTMPTEAALAEMGKFNEELVKAGVMLTGEGLHPPSMGARVVHTLGQSEPQVIDGPYSEAREVIGGYWILDVKDKNEAIAWMKRAPFHHDCIVELRQLQEITDFEPSPAIEREKQMREAMARKG